MDAPAHRYGAELAHEIEEKWRSRWEERGTYLAPNPSGPLAEPNAELAGREAFYVLDMFPYPSGSGPHVGHPLGYIGTDVVGWRDDRAAVDACARPHSGADPHACAGSHPDAGPRADADPRAHSDAHAADRRHPARRGRRGGARLTRGRPRGGAA